MRNIKRYLIYFTICLVSFFCCSNVKADTVFNLDYENYDNSNRLNAYEEIKAYIDNNNSRNLKYIIGYYYQDTFGGSEGIYVMIHSPSSQQTEICNLYVQSVFGRYSGSRDKLSSNFYFNICNGADSYPQNNYTTRLNITLSDYNNNSSAKTTFYNNISSFLNSPSSGNSLTQLDIQSALVYRFNRGQTLNINWNSYFEIYYSSWPVYYIGRKWGNSSNTNEDITTICNKSDASDTYDTTIYYNDGLMSTPLSCGDTFPTYLDFIEQNSQPITVSEVIYKTYNNSLEEEYSSKVVLNILVDPQYQEDTTKCEFTDNFQGNTANFDVNSEYNFETWTNGTLVCNIYRDSEIIEEYSYNLSSIANITLADSYNSTLVGDTLYSVNVHYDFVYGTSEKIPFKIEYMSQEDTNLTNFIAGTRFYYTNPNLQRYETTDVKLENFRCRKTHTNYIYCTGLIDNSFAYFNDFEIQFLLADFDEETNIAYYDNVPPANWRTERDVDFLISSFTGYKKHVLTKDRNKIYIYKATSNSNSIGNIYFPYTLDHSNTIDLIAFYYNDNNMPTHLPSTDYDDYYQQFSVNLENNILVMTFNQANFDDYYNYAYFYAPNDWLVQMQGNVQMNVILRDNDGNKTIITGAYNNTDFYDQHDINSLFDRITNELNRVKPLTTEFSNTFTRMWNKISPERQSLIITCFCMIVIISIVLMARRG